MTKDELQSLIEPLTWEDRQALRKLLDESSQLPPTTKNGRGATVGEQSVNPLKGSVLRYDDPFEPAVPLEDWEVLQ